MILSRHDSVHYLYHALQAGAIGYLVKESAGADVVDAVRSVSQGKRYVTPKITEAVVADLIHQRGLADDPLKNLTARERQIVRLIVEGRTSAEAGKALNLSRKTVETYRSRIMQKLAIENVPALVKFAIKHGLTTIT